MASGIEVDDKVTELYVSMKKVKVGDGDRVKLAAFHIVNSKIDVKTIWTEQGLLDEGKDAFEEMRAQLNEKECAYFLYDCHFQNDEFSNKDELILLSWFPDKANVKDRMTYSCSEQSMKKACSAAPEWL
ncbi:destrin-like isoform X2 [Brachionichthys hirsutus]|uniref:destrin-like isoform X2 n=1 Tax=Brachionichthys hirsutus TaxID=412623 RepID=UPI003605265C